mgnify:CR=1 FL=1
MKAKLLSRCANADVHVWQGEWSWHEYATVCYSCMQDIESNSSCLHAPADMAWFGDDLIVANEGSSGVGTTLSLVQRSVKTGVGSITKWLDGLRSPSSLAWLNSTNLLVTTAAGITQHNVATGSIDKAWGTLHTGSPLGSANATSIAANQASGDVLVAFCDHGVVGKFTSTNSYCKLATGVNCPSGLVLNHDGATVWFMDQNMVLFNVDTGGDGLCPSTVPECVSPSSPGCNGVHVPAVTSELPGNTTTIDSGLLNVEADTWFMAAYVALHCMVWQCVLMRAARDLRIHKLLLWVRFRSSVGAIVKYNASAGTAVVCTRDVAHPRALLAGKEGSGWILVADDRSNSLWRVATDCSWTETYTDNVRTAASPAKASDECVTALFYYKGLIVADNCPPNSSWCHPDRPSVQTTQPDGRITKFYTRGTASELHMVPTPSCNASQLEPSEYGNGVVEHPEECDDGASNGNVTGASCRLNCRLASCGDNVLDAGEACDNGAANSDSTADACRTTCAWASCGDGIIDTGEACDAGVENSDTAADACRSDCTTATCGDGVVDTAEQMRQR